MSNHFPATPADAGVSSIVYRVSISDSGEAASPSPLHSASATTTIDTAGYHPTFTVSFPTPGSYGSWNQDAFEAALNTHIDALCSEFATSLGVPLSDVKSSVSIQRTWSYGSPADNTVWSGSISENMPFTG